MRRNAPNPAVYSTGEIQTKSPVDQFETAAPTPQAELKGEFNAY
jgi:hypothetical protein